MTNREMAESYLAQAGEIMQEVERAFQRGIWNLAVRRAQEVTELSLKAALRMIGVEVPHIHDVGILLKEYRGKFPLAFQQDIDQIAAISRRLRREREVSFYGDDETGAPPQELYVEADARMALEDARFVREICMKLL